MFTSNQKTNYIPMKNLSQNDLINAEKYILYEILTVFNNLLTD